MEYTISVYDENNKCKVCQRDVSERHEDGCEVGVIRMALVAAQQSVHPTLLTERKIDLYCPHCGKKFGIALPASQSG
jgi:hypothetical protein